MHRLLFMIFFLSFFGCAGIQTPEYIQTEKHYTRQLSADIEIVLEAVKEVTHRYGWSIEKIEDPATYERNEYTQRVDQKRFLLITDIRKNPGFGDSGFSHLNIYLYQVNEWTDVDIRYERVKTIVNRFHKFRNDELINQMLVDIEKEVGG